MPILKNQKHELFAQSLAAGASARKAYCDAGYEDSRKNAWRLKTNKDVIERVQEIQCNAARSTEVSIQSIFRELDDAMEVAKARGQAQAMVSASSLKAKLTGLAVDRQEIRVSDGDINQDMSVAEILQKVAREAGLDAAVALCRAFQMDPADFDLSGEPVAAPAPAARSPQLGYSQRALEEAKPVNRKREL